MGSDLSLSFWEKEGGERSAGLGGGVFRLFVLTMQRDEKRKHHSRPQRISTRVQLGKLVLSTVDFSDFAFC